MSVFLLECSNFWGSKISSGRLGGGGGSGLNVQLALRGKKSKYVDGPQRTVPKKRKTRKAVFKGYL